MESTAEDTTFRTQLDDVRHLAVIPVWSDTKPNAAGLFGIGRSHAYVMARTGDLPVIHLGRRVAVLVPSLLKILGADE